MSNLNSYNYMLHHIAELIIGQDQDRGLLTEEEDDARIHDHIADLERGEYWFSLIQTILCIFSLIVFCLFYFHHCTIFKKQVSLNSFVFCHKMEFRCLVFGIPLSPVLLIMWLFSAVLLFSSLKKFFVIPFFHKK